MNALTDKLDAEDFPFFECVCVVGLGSFHVRPSSSSSSISGNAPQANLCNHTTGGWQSDTHTLAKPLPSYLYESKVAGRGTAEEISTK